MRALILAGGVGSRLWPVSRELYPKQFLALNGDESLLREAAERIEGRVEDVVVSTNGDQFFYVRDELRGLVDEGNVLVEPEKRDTAPAIALASRFVEERFGDEPLLVLPSDHVLGDDFFDVAESAEELAEDRLVTFGIEPTYPATGYGYVEPGEELGPGYEVESFREKPGEEEAEALVDDGCLWNSGIFLFRPSVLREELARYEPALADGDYEGMLEGYGSLPETSIDYAVMERSDRVATVPYSGRWTDVGSWSAVHDLMEKDGDGNACKGDVLLRDTSDSLVYGKDRLIAALGLDDAIVVDSADALLVASKDRAEDVKDVVRELEEQGREEVERHRTLHKPWGYLTDLDEGERYGVRRVCVYPGEFISLQRHEHRAEHWVVVKGTAKVTRGGEEQFVGENESVYVPRSTRHRVENPGEVDLHIVEVRTGEYLGEDDVERFE